MDSGKMVRFIERWRDLEKRQKDLDYERSVFARDLRAALPSDAAFTKWCVAEIGLAEPAAQDLLLRAIAAKVVPDVTVWKRVGGFREIRAVAALPRREQVNVLETAKFTGQSIRSIVRGLQNKGDEPVELRRASPSADAQTLAHFVMEHVPQGRLTPKIKAVLARYVRVDAARAA